MVGLSFDDPLGETQFLKQIKLPDAEFHGLISSTENLHAMLAANRLLYLVLL